MTHETTIRESIDQTCFSNSSISNRMYNDHLQIEYLKQCGKSMKRHHQRTEQESGLLREAAVNIREKQGNTKIKNFTMHSSSSSNHSS